MATITRIVSRKGASWRLLPAYRKSVVEMERARVVKPGQSHRPADRAAIRIKPCSPTPCGSTLILIRAADCLLHAALHRWVRSVFDRPQARMRGLALAEIVAVDLDICRLWLVAAPELPFGDQLKAIRCRSYASKTRRSRQSSATSVPSHRSAGFRAAGGTHFAAYSRPLLARSHHRRQTEGHNTCAARSS